MDRFEEVKLRIKDAVDLLEFIESYVALRRRGRHWVGLCPFHDEKTPSFTVFPDTQNYHCFGCGCGGDVFTFAMEREGLSFREAFESLAERGGIRTEGVFRGGEDGERRPRIREQARMLEQVREFFREQMVGPAGAHAREYLEGRGLAAAVSAFGLGYHPAPQWDGAGVPTLAAFARDRGLKIEAMAAAGLLRRRSGGLLEPYAGRLMFPIEDERGRMVAFGARVLPRAEAAAGDKPPKYLNSPESPTFNKRRILFGLRHVKQAGTRRVVVVEGYTDVIACHLNGVTGAVATLGTALTADHARILERWATAGVVLLFDGDRAGRQAAERAFGELAGSDLDLRIALAPEDLDPADLLGSQGAAGRRHFEDLVDGAPDALTVWFQLLRQRHDLSSPVQFERAVLEGARILGAVDRPVRRHVLAEAMARHLGIPRPDLDRLVRPRARRPGQVENRPESRPAAAGPSPLQGAELDLLACILSAPDHLDALQGVSFSDPELVALGGLLEEAVRGGQTDRNTLVKLVFARLGEKAERARWWSRCVERAERISNPPEQIPLILRALNRHRVRQNARLIRSDLQQALASGDRAAADALTRRLVQEKRRKQTPPDALSN